MRKKLLILAVVVLIVIQFFHPAKNQSTDVSSTDITKVVNVPDDVLQVLKTSCYDCHSNNTHYPWYSKIQPIAWWMDHHVQEGKDHLNFSAFGTYQKGNAIHKLTEIAETVSKKEMPLSSYTLMHGDAKLSPQQIELIMSWVNTTTDAASAND